MEPGLEFAPQDFRDALYVEVKGVIDSIYSTHGKGAWKSKLMINDRIADSIFQQIVTRPDEYAVLATPNLNGDYISDAAAAQVGGLGIAPGANIGDQHAIFEATHGTAPKYADKDVINPGSVMLSGVMMFEFMGWHEAAHLIESSSGANHPAEEGDLRLRTHAGKRDQGEDQRVCLAHDPEHDSGGGAGGKVIYCRGGCGRPHAIMMIGLSMRHFNTPDSGDTVRTNA